MGYPASYKNAPCYTQGYAGNPYYTNMSDYFTPAHHHPHHPQFTHHQMTNPYATIPGSHGQHTFSSRTAGECMDSYGAQVKAAEYQVKSEYQVL
jgi:hypothetical protein